MEKKYQCDLCGKKEEFDNCVWYSEEQFNLCKKHYGEWTKHHKPYYLKHKNIKTGTQKWHNNCVKEERLFIQWLKIQKGGLNSSRP